MNKKTLLLALSSLSLTDGAGATTMEQRMSAMERKMEQLQNQLQRSEAENQQLKTQLNTIKVTPVLKTKTAETTPVLNTVNDKFSILEKRFEDDKKAREEAVKKKSVLEVSSQGASFKSADNNYKLNLRGYMQADENYYFEDRISSSSADNDKFGIRRARLTLDGTLFKNVDFRLSPDFAGSGARLFDAFVDLHYFSAASLMAGKFRQPVSLERMQSAPNLTFIERAYPAQLAPNRDLGVMLHGAINYAGYKTQYTTQPVFKEFLGYEVGIFNGMRDGQAVQDTDKDVDNNKEMAARIFSHPFMHTDSVFKGLGLGVSGTWGHPNGNNNIYGTAGALPSLVSAGQQVIFKYDPSTISSGEAYRIYPQMYWYYKSFGMIGEYFISSQQLQGGKKGLSARQENTAWHINASYVLTGEDNSFFGIKPSHPFNPATGHWGAWQLAARYSELNIDNATFDNGFAKLSNSIHNAQSWAVGLNWILNDNVKIMSNYEQTYFLGGATDGSGIINRPIEKVLFTRFQVAF